MRLRNRWSALPSEARLGYVTTSVFCTQFCAAVLVGPDLLLMLFGCLVLLLLALITLLLVCRFVIHSPRRPKFLPLVLVSGCLVISFTTPGLAVKLHLIVCVYRAGGPNALNDWAQGLIREREGHERSPFTDTERIPPGVRTHLRGWVIVDDSVRIERGGGFYHYGVIVVPQGKGSPPERWQKVLGWPPEVVIYHED